MFYCVQTPTDFLVYQDEDLSSQAPALRLTWRTRVAALQAWLDANPDAKFSQLAGAKLIAYTAAVSALKTAGANWVKTHVVQHGEASPGVPKQVALSTATYIGQWDGQQSFVRTLLGTFPAGGIPFMGWPQTDVAPDPPDPPSQAVIDAAVVAAAARQAAQDQWRVDAQAQMALGIPAYQAWYATHPYPA